MKRILLATLFAASSFALMRVVFAQQPDTLRPNMMIGPVPVGGMTVDEAQRALRVWWETEKTAHLHVVAPGLNITLPKMKPGELGVTIDDAASVRIALDTPVNFQAPQDTFAPEFRANGLSLRPLQAILSKAAGADHPARVRYEAGAIVRVPEVVGAEVDETALPDRVGKAIMGNHVVELPMKNGDEKASQEALNQITEVVASFSTHFPTSKRTRCSNIKLASHIIDGTIVMPGERFSFNDVVGRRTLKAGFKLAGIYKNGQHDTGIGGGICQVSTTLYNAALLSDLAIHQRSSHSLPVAYVPLGRDATVDYGNLDLVFENTYPTPIAVTSEYRPGELTFRILGKKIPGQTVQIVRGPLTWEPEEVQQVNDSSLTVGKKKVLKPGSAFRSLRTMRVVYIDGKVVKREPLGRSSYGGQARVVLVGTKPAAPVPTPMPSAPINTAAVKIPPPGLP